MTLVDELSRELAAVGVRGRLRRRILLEAEDHLASGGDEARFGDPRELANAFAAELGTQAATRAAYRAFAALGLAGAAYAAAFLSFRANGHGLPTAASTPAARVALWLVLLAPQLAFVAGSLALARAVRRRGARTLPSAELAVLNRRTATAVACGLVAVGAFVLYAAVVPAPGWWRTLVFAGCGGSVLLLAAAGAPVAAAARFRPRAAGEAGDLFDDLPLPRTDQWRLARLLALGLFVAVAAAGVVQSDPFDGLVRAALEAAACLGGFWALGRFLGLRR